MHLSKQNRSDKNSGLTYFTCSPLEETNICQHIVTNMNQSCQKDNIARRRQPYVNSNNI